MRASSNIAKKAWNQSNFEVVIVLPSNIELTKLFECASLTRYPNDAVGEQTDVITPKKRRKNFYDYSMFKGLKK